MSMRSLHTLTANKVLKIEMHPLPRIDDLFSTLSEGQAFLMLDFSHTYLQVQLSNESQKYLVINTHKGFYA